MLVNLGGSEFRAGVEWPVELTNRFPVDRKLIQVSEIEFSIPLITGERLDDRVQVRLSGQA